MFQIRNVARAAAMDACREAAGAYGHRDVDAWTLSFTLHYASCLLTYCHTSAAMVRMRASCFLEKIC